MPTARHSGVIHAPSNRLPRATCESLARTQKRALTHARYHSYIELVAKTRRHKLGSCPQIQGRPAASQKSDEKCKCDRGMLSHAVLEFIVTL